MRHLTTLTVLLCIFLAGCGGGPKLDGPPTVDYDADPLAAPVVVSEVFRTRDWEKKNVDSAALWRDPANSRNLLFVTGKESDSVLVLDGETGDWLMELGSEGDAPGLMNRPNGVFVLDDLLYVVERNNQRVQVFELPSFHSLGSFGEEQLKYPYGVSVVATAPGVHEVYVTDDYDVGPDPAATASMLDKRIKHFRVSRAGSGIDAEHIHTFGDKGAEGGLYVVESILADPENDRLFICDEMRDDVKVYSMGGEFTGTVFAGDIIGADTEGLALVRDESAPGGGYLIVTEQTKSLTIFRVFSRDATRYLGSFTGEPRLANTDGIWFEQGDVGDAFQEGALYAIHDDRSVAAYSWKDIRSALGL